MAPHSPSVTLVHNQHICVLGARRANGVGYFPFSIVELNRGSFYKRLHKKSFKQVTTKDKIIIIIQKTGEMLMLTFQEYNDTRKNGD